MAESFRVFDCAITSDKLETLAALFVPDQDVYYIDGDGVAKALLTEGIAVYSRPEFGSSFPTFSLKYGSLYGIWSMQFSDTTCVAAMNADQLASLPPNVSQAILAQQVKLKRGHIYKTDWFNEFEKPQTHTIIVDEEWYYLLTSKDWWAFDPEIRRRWVLQWLMACRADEQMGTSEFDRRCDGVPYDLIDEYAGTFAEHSGPNCFAAAIAMVVAGRDSKQYLNSRILISQWLHQGTFFNLLREHEYSKAAEWQSTRDLSGVQPADVMIWYGGDGSAGHAAFAVSNELVFQKQAQGWEAPWQVVRIADVWYNEYLKSDGYIAVYRRM